LKYIIQHVKYNEDLKDDFMKRLKQVEKRNVYNWVSRLLVVVVGSYIMLSQYHSLQQLSEQVAYLNRVVKGYEITTHERVNNKADKNIITIQKTKSAKQIELQKLLKKAYHYYENTINKSEVPNAFDRLVIFEVEESDMDKNKQLILNALFSSELDFLGWDTIIHDIAEWERQAQDLQLQAILQSILVMSIQEET